MQKNNRQIGIFFISILLLYLSGGALLPDMGILKFTPTIAGLMIAALFAINILTFGNQESVRLYRSGFLDLYLVHKRYPIFF